MNIWKNQPKKKVATEYLNSDIVELSLSVRSYNCLKRAGCSTIGDVIRIIDEDENGLKRIRNLGSRSEEEILSKIQEFREGYESIDYDSRDRNDGDEEDSLPIRRRKKMYSADEVWNSNIEDYHLSNFALNGLKEHGIVYVKDLYATNPKDEPGWYAVRELFEKLPKC